MDYEELELELEILPDRIRGYDSNIYKGRKFKNFLNYRTYKTELIYSFDILKGIIITLYNNYCVFQEVVSKLERLIGDCFLVQENKYILYKFKVNDLNLWYCTVDNNHYIIIAPDSIISPLLYSISSAKT